MLTNSGVPEIQKAVETLKTINDDLKTRAEALAHKKASDYISKMPHTRSEFFEQAFIEGFIQGYEEGFIQSYEEGFEQGIKETAKAMKQMGADVNFIAKATGLSLPEIEEL